MGSIGGLNPLPYHCGGGPSGVERIYSAMRRVVGTGGSAPDQSGLDGLWRRCRAHGIAAAWSAVERATLQFFPHLATDGLPYYSRVTGLVQGRDEPDAAIRQRVWAAFVASLRADCPSIAMDLAALDARVSLLEPDMTVTTQHGRAFGPLPGATEDPAMVTSVCPNYSTDFVLYVLFDVGHEGALTTSEQRTLKQIESYLRGVLPAWVTFVILTDDGFALDLSLLDLTGFGA